jgi:glycine dehydrogenase subunit 1
MATVYISCFGKHGLRELALMNLSKADHAKKAVAAVHGCRLAFSSPTFNEFVLRVDGDPEDILKAVRKEHILGGISLGKFYPELNQHILVTVTELNAKNEIDRWAEVMKNILE